MCSEELIVFLPESEWDRQKPNKNIVSQPEQVSH